MASACALAIISGKNIYNFAILENLRIFQNCFFTEGVAAANSSCRTCFLRKHPHGGRVLAPRWGAVAQRLRGFKSAEPEKTVKRSSRRTGVNLQFFPV